MTERRPYDIAAVDFERVVRGLPRREPSAALRSRVLAAATSARPPRARTRATVTPVALIALLALDFLAITIQDRQLARSLPAPPAATVAAAPAPDADLAWLRDLGLPEQSMAIVALTRQTATRNTYLTLRDSLLTNGSGG